QSRRIVKQAVRQFPSGGEIMARMPKLIRPPAGEVYTSVESPLGELGDAILSEGKPQQNRNHILRPSYVNHQLLTKLLYGQNISNMVAIHGSNDNDLVDLEA
ncbi:NADH-quinone oxidoreductase subunit D, partial [Hydrogenibacillus schlegelii]